MSLHNLINAHAQKAVVLKQVGHLTWFSWLLQYAASHPTLGERDCLQIVSKPWYFIYRSSGGKESRGKEDRPRSLSLLPSQTPMVFGKAASLVSPHQRSLCAPNRVCRGNFYYGTQSETITSGLLKEHAWGSLTAAFSLYWNRLGQSVGNQLALSFLSTNDNWGRGVGWRWWDSNQCMQPSNIYLQFEMLEVKPVTWKQVTK